MSNYIKHVRTEYTFSMEPIIGFIKSRLEVNKVIVTEPLIEDICKYITIETCLNHGFTMDRSILTIIDKVNGYMNTNVFKDANLANRLKEYIDIFYSVISIHISKLPIDKVNITNLYVVDTEIRIVIESRSI